MRRTTFIDRDGNEQKQTLVDKYGAKSLKKILIERGLYKETMDKAAMVAVLASQPDFLHQKSLVQELIERAGHACLFLPKFHPELNPLERVWGAAKRYQRNHPPRSVKGLRRLIPKALASVQPQSIRAFFELADAWAEVYRKNLSFKDAAAVVKAGAKARREARATAESSSHDDQDMGDQSEERDSENVSEDDEGDSDESADENESDSENENESDSEHESENDSENESDIESENESDNESERKHSSRESEQEHKHRNLDAKHEKEEPHVDAPVGIQNREDADGNQTQCFAICAVQVLLSVPVFKTTLLQMAKLKYALSLCDPVVRSLIKLTEALDRHRNHHVSFQEFMAEACYSAAHQLTPVYTVGQNDSAEFLAHLFERLRREPQFALQLGENAFDKCMQFRVGTATHCPKCERRSESVREGDQKHAYDLMLSAAKFHKRSSFHTAFDQLTEITTKTMACPNSLCRAKGPKKRHAVFLSSPEVLFVHIDRSMESKKSKKAIQVPTASAIPVFDGHYELLAVSVHRGQTVQAGHWTALLRRDGHWFDADDTQVTPINISTELAKPFYQQNVAGLLFIKRTELAVVAMDED